MYLDHAFLGQTFQGQLEHLLIVFQRFGGAHLTLKTEKCELFQKKLQLQWWIREEETAVTMVNQRNNVTIDPKETECSTGLTNTRKYVHKGASLGCVHTKRGSQLETTKTHCHQHNWQKKRGHPVVLKHWGCVHIPQIIAEYCTDLMLLRTGGKVYCGHRHGQRSYWRSLALKVSSGWCLTDHRQGQKHTNLYVISPNPSSAPAHVQATMAFIHSVTLFSVYPYTGKVPRMWKLSK